MSVEPLDPVRAVLALEEARDRDEIFDLVLRAVRPRVSAVALLAVHLDHIRDKRGVLEALHLARNTVPAFEAAIRTRAAAVVPIATGVPEIDGRIAQLAGASGIALLLPIAVGARTVALVVGRCESAAVGIGDLVPLVTASNLALARVHAGRVKTAKPERAVTAGYELEISFESGVAARRAALARHRQQEAWAPLAETIRELVRDGMDGGDPDEDEQVELMLELARIESERLGQPDRAIDTYVRVLAWESDNATAAAALEPLYAARGDWKPLAALMLDRAARAEDPVAALEAVAEMYEHKVGDAHAAYLVWLAVVRRAPERLAAQLDRLAARASSRRELASETGALAAEIAPEHPAIAASLWRVAGELHERDEIRAAIASYENARAADPGAAAVLIALHRAYLTIEAWTELGELLPSLIDALAPTAPLAVVVDLHVELGHLLADRLGRPDEAVREFTDALALDPTNAAAFSGLAAAGKRDAILDAIEAAIDLASRTEQLARYAQIASEWHELGRFDRAAACWDKLRALDPRAEAPHRGLVRALEASGDWAGLADALRARLAISDERVAILAELARVLEFRLDDGDGACAAAQEIVALEPQHRAALETLARLHARAGRTQPALEALQRLLAQTTDARARAELLQQIGQAHLDERDATTARASLVEAIALDPKHARAREGLARVHLQQGELVAAGEDLLRAAQLSTPGDAIRCLADAAWLYRHRLGDPERARSCLVRILDLEPTHLDAKQALAELLHDAEEWETLWPHLQEQIRQAKDDVPAELLLRAARCALELGKSAAAIELFERAWQREPTPAIQIERAAALYRTKSLDAAASAYQAIPTRGLDRAQLLAIYHRLAQIHTELGSPVQAQTFHGKVLDLDPAHRETLDELAELQLARGLYDDAIASLRGLAETAAKPERLALLERIGDLYRHQLQSSGRAASAYLEALDLDPANHRLLQRLLDLQTETGQWRLATKTIERFLEHERDHARRGAYFLAAAEIRRTQLVDHEGALDCYESGIDELLRETPLRTITRVRALDAFHAVERRAIADEDWKYLEESYRRMIARLSPDDALAITMWDELGELYRLRLDQPLSAIQALEAAHAMDPDKSPRRRRILGDLYTQLGAVRAASVMEPLPQPERVVEVAEPPTDLHARAAAAAEAGRVDETWCLCRALVFRKEATASEEALYKKYQPHEVRKATGIIDEETWAQLRHPDEDRVISAIFALVWENLAALRAGSPKSFELRPKDRIPVETDTRVVAKIFRHASRLLNVPLRDVYAQPRRSGRLLLANCIEKGRLAPAVIVGRDLMVGYRDTEIAAAVGAMMALLRPGSYLRLTLPTIEELEAALVAAARLVGRKLGRAALDPLVEIFVPRMQKVLTRPIAETLLAFANHLSDQPDLARWRNAVDATAHRAGLLVSGELAATARMIASEPMVLGGVRPTERVADLVEFSVSPGYLALRRHVGIAIR